MVAILSRKDDSVHGFTVGGVWMAIHSWNFYWPANATHAIELKGYDENQGYSLIAVTRGNA